MSGKHSPSNAIHCASTSHTTSGAHAPLSAASSNPQLEQPGCPAVLGSRCETEFFFLYCPAVKQSDGMANVLAVSQFLLSSVSHVNRKKRLSLYQRREHGTPQLISSSRKQTPTKEREKQIPIFLFPTPDTSTSIYSTLTLSPLFSTRDTSSLSFRLSTWRRSSSTSLDARDSSARSALTAACEVTLIDIDCQKPIHTAIAAPLSRCQHPLREACICVFLCQGQCERACKAPGHV